MRPFSTAFQIVMIMLFALSAHAEVITFDNPDLSNWNTDRYTPNSFQRSYFDGDYRLQIGISQSDLQPSSFYNYQGKSTSFNADISQFAIVGDLFVDSLWTDANVGIWGVLFDSTNIVSGYPIVAWRSSSTGAYASGFYAFNYYSLTGGWISLGTDYSTGDWYSIMMRYTGTSMDYYINGDLKYSYADEWQDGVIGKIILNSYNFGSDYTVYWDNVGVAPVPEPATGVLLGMGLLGIVGFVSRRRR